MALVMMQARYVVRFEDVNYERMAEACGATVLKLEPKPGGLYTLHVEGERGALDAFSADLGWSPESIQP